MKQNKVDVLFIHPSNHKENYQSLANEFSAVAPPVWTLLAANYIRKSGYKVAIYDSGISGMLQDNTSEILSKYNPELIVILVYGHNPSASTQSMPGAIKIVNNIKNYNRDIPIALGGIHPSALPSQTIKSAPIDYILQGEGPKTIKGLLEMLKGKKDILKIEGLWYFKNQEPTFTFPSTSFQDIDRDLDDYAWDLIPPLSNYKAHNMHLFQDFSKSKKSDFSDVRSPYVAMNTSLGCPYSCNYCSINAIFGKPSIRYWSIDTVIRWIDALVLNHNIRNIRFDDELFILSPKRVEEFCDKIIERKYDLNIWVYGRVDTIKPNLLHKMKLAGINWICLGIESANDNVRLGVGKKINKSIKNIVKEIQNNDIFVLGNYMFGLPNDDMNTMQETLDLAIDLNCEFANFYSVMPYPGSKLYEDNKENLSENWSEYSQLGFYTKPMPNKQLSSSQILSFRDHAFHEYFNRDAYFEMIKERFGMEVQLHIKRMLELKLTRNILKE